MGGTVLRLGLRSGRPCAVGGVRADPFPEHGRDILVLHPPSHSDAHPAADPIFILLGYALPLLVYRAVSRLTIVERLCKAETKTSALRSCELCLLIDPPNANTGDGNQNDQSGHGKPNVGDDTKLIEHRKDVYACVQQDGNSQSPAGNAPYCRHPDQN